jgi:hypothetical protein
MDVYFHCRGIFLLCVKKGYISCQEILCMVHSVGLGAPTNKTSLVLVAFVYRPAPGPLGSPTLLG